jgi:hypothetical protein
MMRASTKGITVVSHTFTGLLCMALVGCDIGTQDQSDFGASVVATYIVDAQRECARAGYEDLVECREAPRSNGQARKAAVIADDAYIVFQSSCYESLGSATCEGFMASAYAQATRAATQAKPVAQAPSPARSPAP